jgi:XTP/dITP diphosphohydrolase
MGQRSAAFVTVAAIAFPNGEVQVAHGRLEGLITETAIGSAGFGYDPVFLVLELGKTLAELTPGEKNRISHRAKAFVKAKEILRSLQSASIVGA